MIIESFIDPWGESDTILGDLTSKGFYDENKSLAYWCYLASKVPDDSWIMVDVGAFSGMWSLIGARFLSNGSIVSLEASNVTYGSLVKNILLNSLDTRVIAANYAATDTYRDVTLVHPYGIYTTSSGESILNSDDQCSGFDHTQTVKGIPLDILKDDPRSRPGVLGSSSTLLSKGHRIFAVKIDVEGHEIHVIRGMQRILEQDSPFIICEVLSDSNLTALKYFLDDYGYSIFDVSGERNFLFIPERHQDLFDDMNEFISNNSPALYIDRYHKYFE